MPQLGMLGNCLVQAAQKLDSSVAALITTQKYTIEEEGKTRLRKISGKKTTRGMHVRKNRPYPKKEKLFHKPASSRSSASMG